MFNGHKGAVTCLCLTNDGLTLASGSTDNDVVLWDISSEQGICRLSGHSDQVTGLLFVDSFLLSCSKDMSVKVWDLQTRHCFLTIPNRSECWSVGMIDSFLVVGLSDAVRVFRIIRTEEIELQFFGNIERESKERVVDMKVQNMKLAIQNNDKTLDIFCLRSQSDVTKRMLKKQKKAKRKGNEIQIEPSVSDHFKSLAIVRAKAKIRSFDFSKDKIQVSVGNSLETYHIIEEEKRGELDSSMQIAHSSDIKDIALNSSEDIVLSVSKNSVKLWNCRSGTLIRSFECGPAVCCAFVDDQVVVGTRNGQIELYDVASGFLLESLEAHSGTVWGIEILEDGIVSGGADKTVKYWTKEYAMDENYSSTKKRLTLTHHKTLELDDEVLALRFSTDKKYLAVSLLDCTVKVFYADSLKFYLSLYGHKLPVTEIDISADSTMIVTASSDKNIKIWGLDFGDCHKSIFAHSDGITSVRFIANTHYFLSAGKDGVIKYWDGDSFAQILKLSSHYGSVNALAVSKSGSFFVSGSSDRSIRVWLRSYDQVFIEEEEEKELEEILDNVIEENDSQQPTKQSAETITSSEKVFDAIELANEEEQKYLIWEAGMQRGINQIKPRNPVFEAYGVERSSDYLLKILESVKPSEIEPVILMLPYSHILDLLKYIRIWTNESKNIPLTCRILFFILSTFNDQLVNSANIKQLLEDIKSQTQSNLKKLRALFGVNIAGLDFLKRSWELEHGSNFFSDIKKEKEAYVVKKRVVTE